MNGQLLIALLVTRLSCGGLAACMVLMLQAKRRRTGLLARMSALESELWALCSCQRVAGDRLVDLQDEARQLMEGQTRLEMQSAGGNFLQARTLLDRGAKSEDLVTHCGLAPGEAELMCRVRDSRLE